MYCTIKTLTITEGEEASQAMTSRRLFTSGSGVCPEGSDHKWTALRPAVHTWHQHASQSQVTTRDGFSLLCSFCKNKEAA